MNPLAILVVPLGYLLGSFPSGYLAGQWCAGVDIRQLGSGSTGATNVLRQVGKGPALVVFLVDVIKGSAAVIVARGLLGAGGHQPAIGAGAYGWLVAAGAQQAPGHDHRGAAFDHIHEKHDQGRPFAHLPEHIGGAGGSRAQLANVDAGAPLPGEIAAGETAEQVAQRHHQNRQWVQSSSSS